MEQRRLGRPQHRLFSSALLLGAVLGDPLPLWGTAADSGMRTSLGERFGELRLSGSNTFRTEYYNVTGDQAASPYAETGWQTYNDLSLSLHGQVNAYDFWQADIVGTINDSVYRGEDRGMVPERLRFSYQSGTAPVPYRLELGDFYGYLSYRTLQSSLKGAQLELHPDLGGTDARHSLIFLSGASQNSWRHFQASDNYTNAASWLVERGDASRMSLNLVHNLRDGDPSGGILRRSQYVGSLAAQQRLRLGEQAIDLEGEIGRFWGDHDGLAGAASGQNRAGTALFLQAAGRGASPLTYRFRFEAYEQDYLPVGAAVPADRRSGEAHAGWKFANGLQLRGRLQHFRDDWQTNNPLDTKTAGISLSGPVLSRMDPGLNGNLDFYVQDSANRNRTTDSLSKTMSLNLSRPLTEMWNGRLGLYGQCVDDHTVNSADTTTLQAQFQADRSVTICGFNGTLSPGLTWRKIHQPADQNLQLLPTFSANLARGPHQLDYATTYEHQDALSRGTNLGTFSHNLQYRYVRQNDTFGIGCQSLHRDPQDGRNTASYLFSMHWTHLFGGRDTPERDLPRAGAGISGGFMPDLASGSLALTDFVPGLSIEQVRQRLATANAPLLGELPGQLVYEVRLLSDFDERQRLALSYEDGRLTRATLIIDFDPVGRPEVELETVARIRQALLARFGAPANSYETGEVKTNLAAAVNSGAFVRIIEWARPQGTLRFGLPRRLDRQVRMEVQFAAGFPPQTDSLWSIETVR